VDEPRQRLSLFRAVELVAHEHLADAAM
jgi:hypothetical protein